MTPQPGRRWPSTSSGAGASFINDVALTNEGAWFTEACNLSLYFVPIVNGAPGPSAR